MANNRSIWDIRRDFDRFNTLSQLEKDRLIDEFITEENSRTYVFLSTYRFYKTCFTNEQSLKIIELGLNSKSQDNYLPHVIIEELGGPNNDAVLGMVRKSKHRGALRTLFYIPNGPSLDDEELALRALGNTIPDQELYEKRYTPSLEVIKRLPPILRLDVLEGLSSHRHIGYNIFQNLGDIDDFRSLLFGAVVRYGDRVEELVSKYKEIIQKGVPARITVKGHCENCGDYIITVTSSVVRTEVGLDESRLSINHNWCPLCGHRMENNPSVTSENI